MTSSTEKISGKLDLDTRMWLFHHENPDWKPPRKITARPYKPKPRTLAPNQRQSLQARWEWEVIRQVEKYGVPDFAPRKKTNLNKAFDKAFSEN